jgi:hypothetical protein
MADWCNERRVGESFPPQASVPAARTFAASLTSGVSAAPPDDDTFECLPCGYDERALSPAPTTSDGTIGPGGQPGRPRAEAVDVGLVSFAVARHERKPGSHGMRS